MLESDQIGAEAPPYEGALRERTQEHLRSALGDERFAAALDEGRGASLQELVPESLGVLD